MIAALALAAVLACFNPHVADGDTITCAHQRVRLYGVDAPEIRHGRKPAQPWSYEAKDRLYELTRGRVVCHPAGNREDRYRREVAKCAGLAPDLGAEMVREGLAHDWPRYSGGEYAPEEGEARDARRGMWR
jgi:endonuclease YncB( thermonuclease family)